jgi:Protein of unknown function (DUF3300)
MSGPVCQGLNTPERASAGIPSFAFAVNVSLSSLNTDVRTMCPSAWWSRGKMTLELFSRVAMEVIEGIRRCAMFKKQLLSAILVGSLIATNSAIGFADAPGVGQQAPVPGGPQTPEQLQQLVAPIALYPDELVAEVLAAATYPAQVVEADRWLQDHKNLQGKQLADEVNKQLWDSSVKALTEFPSVVANMDQNLSWTSALGDAYMSQEQDVMNAVQAMRQRASKSGNLNSTSQQKVTNQGNNIVIGPAAPEIVYVPTYDPWLVYGAPLVAWPGWYWYPGLYVATPGISFGFGFGVGFFGGFGWGWNHWGCDWGHRTVIVNHRTYISHNTMINRNRVSNRNAFSQRQASFNHGSRAVATHARFSQAHATVFHGFSHGGAAGGFHGGGFHGGGGRR